MMPSLSSSRRLFLKTLARLYGVLFLLPLFPSRILAALHPEELLVRRVARILGRPRGSAVLIGEICLQEAVPEREAQRVAQWILAHAPALADACREADDQRFQIVVRQQIQQDFATGKVVNVAGYVLSVTEARLCSLAALVTRQGL